MDERELSACSGTNCIAFVQSFSHGIRKICDKNITFIGYDTIGLYFGIWHTKTVHDGVHHTGPLEPIIKGKLTPHNKEGMKRDPLLELLPRYYNATLFSAGNDTLLSFETSRCENRSGGVMTLYYIIHTAVVTCNNNGCLIDPMTCGVVTTKKHTSWDASFSNPSSSASFGQYNTCTRPWRKWHLTQTDSTSNGLQKTQTHIYKHKTTLEKKNTASSST